MDRDKEIQSLIDESAALGLKAKTILGEMTTNLSEFNEHSDIGLFTYTMRAKELELNKMAARLEEIQKSINDLNIRSKGENIIPFRPREKLKK